MSGLRKKLKKMIILWTFTSRDLKAVPEETKVPNQQFTNFYEVLLRNNLQELHELLIKSWQ